MNSFLLRLCLLLSLGANGLAQADEALIRKNLQARLPDMGKIDEVRKSELPGLLKCAWTAWTFITPTPRPTT